MKYRKSQVIRVLILVKNNNLNNESRLSFSDDWEGVTLENEFLDLNK